MDYLKLVPAKLETKLANIKVLQLLISVTKDVYKQDAGNFTLSFGVEKVEQTAAAALYKIDLKVKT